MNDRKQKLAELLLEKKFPAVLPSSVDLGGVVVGRF